MPRARELRPNAATRGGKLDYRASTAQWHAERAAGRPKPAKLALNATLRTYVQDRLAGMVVAASGAAVPGPTVPWKGRRHGPRKERRWASAWSPEQIAHRLRHNFPHDETMRISHEAIYQSLYVQGRGALRRELTACLRTGRALRVPRARSRGRGKSFVVPEIMISERPAEVCDRAVPGHWEGDLILGLESSAIGTLVERTTRLTMLLHLPWMAEHGVGARVKNGPALAGHGADLLIQNRADSPRGVWHQRSGQSRCVRPHRTVLQPVATPLDYQVSEPHGVQADKSVGLSSVSTRPAAAQLPATRGHGMERGLGRFW